MIASPFPGMDPYLEAPDMWPDVHTRLLNILAEQLAPLLAPKYVAELDTQIVIERFGDEVEPEIVLPDVTLARRQGSPASGLMTGVVADTLAPPTMLPMTARVSISAPVRLVTLSIRHREREKPVTVIEMLSPVNKRRGQGRRDYLDKREAYLNSPVNLVEIDLLRSYIRMPFDTRLPPSAYLIMISRVRGRPHCDVWPITVRQPLPILPVPLLSPDPTVPLDLGLALRTAYERARYDLRIDYTKDPQPPLALEDSLWAEALISGWQEEMQPPAASPRTG